MLYHQHILNYLNAIWLPHREQLCVLSLQLFIHKVIKANGPIIKHNPKQHRKVLHDGSAFIIVRDSK